MPQHLLLRLEAPLMSFGTVAVDHNRPVQPWPAASLLTGLLANALGWRREHGAALDGLQARLRWAARIDRPGVALEDFQTAQLEAEDRGWTTRGLVETRAGGPNTYLSPHIRRRHFRADASVLVALRLEPAGDPPTLQALAAALDQPARPLFLGRKSCLPATRLCLGLVEADDAVVALAHQPVAPGGQPAENAAIYFNQGAAPDPQVGPGWRCHETSDERRFVLDVHAGRQTVHERVTRSGP
jgi:CRISPR system Cascade subunit CasD